jgi:L-threonylcarbamoyladenylate synthase
LLRGEVVAVPSETVYGLAADATNEAAVGKIFAAKGRPSFNPLIVHVGRQIHSLDALVSRGLVDASRLDRRSMEIADALIETFWPGPLTIVLPRGQSLADAVTGGLDTVGFRMPNNAVFLDLIGGSGRPLAAPSANRSNRISPTAASHVIEELGGRIPLVLDGGPTSVGIESTIVAVKPRGELVVLRQGGIALEKIERVAGQPVRPCERHATEIIAPGMLKEHYAPQKGLHLVYMEQLPDGLSRIRSTLGFAARVGILLCGVASTDELLSIVSNHFTIRTCQELPDNDVVIARRLFAELRQLDGLEIDAIVLLIPGQKQRGLWPAIYDRLTRASSGTSQIYRKDCDRDQPGCKPLLCPE